jgi:hypothetical protein
MYHWFVWVRNASELSRYQVGAASRELCTVSQPQVLLFQAGWAIVIWLPAMLCTGEYRLVKSPSDSNSMRPWSGRVASEASAGLLMVRPVGVGVTSELATLMAARGAMTPST